MCSIAPGRVYDIQVHEGAESLVVFSRARVSSWYEQYMCRLLVFYDKYINEETCFYVIISWSFWLLKFMNVNIYIIICKSSGVFLFHNSSIPERIVREMNKKALRSSRGKSDVLWTRIRGFLSKIEFAFLQYFFLFAEQSKDRDIRGSHWIGYLFSVLETCIIYWISRSPSTLKYKSINRFHFHNHHIPAQNQYTKKYHLHERPSDFHLRYKNNKQHSASPETQDA